MTVLEGRGAIGYDHGYDTQKEYARRIDELDSVPVAPSTPAFHFTVDLSPVV